MDAFEDIRAVLDGMKEALPVDGSFGGLGARDRRSAVRVSESGRVFAVVLEEGGGDGVGARVLNGHEGDGPPDWRTLDLGVSSGSYPWVVEDPSALHLGLNAVLPGAPRTAPAGGYWLTLAGGTLRERVATLDRVRGPVAAALGPDGALYLLAREWYPPVEDPSFVRLLLSRYRADGTRDFEVTVPGTERAPSYPDQYAVHVGLDGVAHVVYDVYGPPKSPAKELRHVAFDGHGDPLGDLTSLGGAPRYPLLTAIIGDPRGALLALQIYRPVKDEAPTEHQVLTLPARDPGLARSRYLLVDRALDLHAFAVEAGGALHRVESNDASPPSGPR